jgi:hypothetical protein
MSYIGSNPVTQSFIAGTDYFNGNGSTTAFTLSRSVVSVNDIQATVNNVVQQPNDAYTVSGNTITFTSAPSSGTNNVYVRYLSTTTQSITPSQGTVGWAQLNSDVQQDLGISFKNRIINGAMVIAQRGTTSQATNNIFSYPVDRTYATSNSATNRFDVQQNAGSVTPPVGFTNYFGCTSTGAYTPSSAEQFILRQSIEGYNIADLGWGTANAKTITLSFWVRSSLTGTFSGSLYNDNGTRSFPFTYTISSANTWEFKTITIVGDATGTWLTTNGVGVTVGFNMGAGSTLTSTANSWQAGYFVGANSSVNLVGTNAATWYMTGLQFEVGTQATTFDYRSIGTELQLCQRYYQQIGSGFLMGNFYSSTSAVGTFPFFTQMRATPTAAITGAITLTDTGANYTQSAATISSNYMQANGGALDLGSFSGLTAYRPYWYSSSNSSNRLFTFSAEL